jgi:YesN/AraC family two-component response regulator
MGRILLVDDNRNFRLSLKIGLTREGFKVHTAANVADAIQLLVQTSFDFLITDIKMPKLDGYDLIRIAKELKPNLSVVLISAFDFKEYDLRYPEFSDIPKLNKPFPIEGLVAITQDKIFSE